LTRASGAGPGGGVDRVNATLCNARGVGSVYLFAWSRRSPKTIHLADPAVQYVGETGLFLRQMGQFGTSAGFWGERNKRHSAGWRWPKGRTEHLWVGFFEVDGNLLPHLGRGMRRWMEPVALEVHRERHGVLPPLNRVEDGELKSLKLW
jgi:hypothetical protein